MDPSRISALDAWEPSWCRYSRDSAIERQRHRVSHLLRLLGLTGDVTEMLLHWTAGVSGGFVQYGPKGEVWESKRVASAQGSCHTYTYTGMCHAPATNKTNFVNLGQLCEAVMIGLTPDAEYQYRISVDGGKSFASVANFRAAPKVDPEYSFSF